MEQLKKATPEQIVRASRFWNAAHVASMHKERRGADVFIVFKLESGVSVDLNATALFSYGKTAPILFAGTGYPIERMVPEEWRTYARAIYDAAGPEVVTSSDADDIADLLRQWLGSQHSRTDKNLKMAENITVLTGVMRDGKLDAYHDGKVLIFRLMPFVSYATKERQGFSRHDITGILYKMGFRHKRIKGFRFWTGDFSD